MYFKDLIHTNNCIDDFLNNGDKSRPIILFGAGFAVEKIIIKLETANFNIAGICDNNKARHGTLYKEKYEIMSLDESIQRFPNALYIISTPNYFEEIRSQLEDKVSSSQISNIDFDGAQYFTGTDFKKFVMKNAERFQKFYENLSDKQSREVLYNITKAHFSGERDDFKKALSTNDDWYLFKSLLKPTSATTYVDCGAYDGDTLVEFKNAAKNGYKKIIAFEPDKEIQSKLYACINENNIENVEVINKGAFDKEETLKFYNSGVYSVIENSNSCIQSEVVPTEIEVVSMDKVLKDEESVDIIKLDIEGAEYRALVGASETIKKHKPKIAACLYHNISDFIEIQELLLSLIPEYKLVLRQHLPNSMDTILYAYV